MDQQLSIKDVQAQTGVSNYTLRYYEKAGLLNGVDRLESGRRIYTALDVEWIKTLKLLRITGMPIQKMLHLVKLKSEGDASIEKRLTYFKEYRAELRQQIAMREAAIKTINKKIEHHNMLLARRNKEKENGIYR